MTNTCKKKIDAVGIHVVPVLFADFFVSVCSSGVPGCFTHPWPPPVLGISSPWVWLLEDGDSHGMAAPDMLLGLQGMDVPACSVGCCPAETTAGQASTWAPYTPCSRPDTLVCCGGPNRALNSTG